MRNLLSAVVLFLAAGCGHDRRAVRLATDGTLFDLGGTGTVAQATVPYTVTNRGDETIFLPACGGRPLMVVEQGVAGRWDQYAGGVCATADLQTPIELRAGQSVTSQYYFYQPGHYRMRLHWSPSAAKVYADESSTSNPFDVR